ncbi:MAG TPA: PAS domain S-box protein [Candidatus Thermoplasmatota archaeon]|jgi:PAS domain S-box-containing protein|nr:PAS domain S-box protein [Candidatus Thermoplasmatota archaeon]
MLPADERALLEEASGAIIAATDDGRIAFLSRDAEQLLGRTAAASEGLPLGALMPPRMRGQHLAGFGRFQRTGRSHLEGKPVMVPALRGDGVEIEIELQIRIFRRPDDTHLIVAAAREVTAQEPASRGVLELEDAFTRRAYMLV